MFRSTHLLIFTVLVCAQGAAGYYLNSRREYVPVTKPLTSIPQQAGSWTMVKEFPIEAEVQEVLKADDTLSRYYVGPMAPQGVGLFIAFFKTQRAGSAPHSPKNCLPGNGWVSEKSTVIHVDVPGRETPVEANYYLVQRGDNKSVVVYWYQSHGRTVADEYKAKLYVMSDAIRLNRTDTALVRVTVGVGPGGVQGAEQVATEFVRTMYGPMAAVLPN